MNITTREIIKYAENNGYDSVKFRICRNGKYIVSGKFLDAFYEFVDIPIIGGGFTRINKLEQVLGYDLDFEVIEDEEKWRHGVFLDFVLREKEVPDEYKIAQVVLS